MPLTYRNQLIAAIGDPATLTASFNRWITPAYVPATCWVGTGNGSWPGGGPTPAAATTCSSATAGALAMPPAAASSSMQLSALDVFTSSATANGPTQVTLLDRAAQTGGISSSITTVQTVAISAPGRITDATGYVPYIEVSAAATGLTTTLTFTFSYTNTLGVSGRAAILQFPYGTGLSVATQTWPAILQAGDLGARSIETVQVTAGKSTTSGNYAVVLARPLTTTVHSSGPSSNARRGASRMITLGPSPCLYFTAIGAAGLPFAGSYSVLPG